MKKLISVLLCAVMLLSLAACGRESAESVVEKAIKSVKDLDLEAMNSYWSDDAIDVTDDVLESESDAEALEVLKLITDKMTYEIIDSQEDEKAGTATVTVSFTNINMGVVLSTLLSEMFTELLFLPEEEQPTEEEINSMVMEKLKTLATAEDAEMTTMEVDIHLDLVDDQWKISNSETAADAMFGGMISSMSSMS